MAKRDPSNESLARKIWLAGLGAYGRALTDAADSVAKVSQDTAKRFDDLAQRGADIEAKTTEMMTGKVNLFDRPPLEERLAMFRTAFGMPAKSTDTAEEADPAAAEAAEDDGEDVEALQAQVAELQAKLNALAAKLEPDDT